MRIVAFTNMGQTLLIKNMIASLKKISRDKDLVLYCLDEESLEEMSKVHDGCVLFENSATKDQADYGQEDFNEVTYQKVRILDSELNDGHSFLFVDADVSFFKDPIPYIEEALSGDQKIDIIFQSDLPGTAFCTGFMYLNNVEKTREVVSDVVKTMGERSGPDWWCDQNYLIDSCSRNKATIGILPRQLFPNGSWIFNEGNDLGNAFIMHANYVIGKQAKIDKLKEYGGWLLETV